MDDEFKNFQTFLKSTDSCLIDLDRESIPFTGRTSLISTQNRNSLECNFNLDKATDSDTFWDALNAQIPEMELFNIGRSSLTGRPSLVSGRESFGLLPADAFQDIESMNSDSSDVEALLHSALEDFPNSWSPCNVFTSTLKEGTRPCLWSVSTLNCSIRSKIDEVRNRVMSMPCLPELEIMKNEKRFSEPIAEAERNISIEYGQTEDSVFEGNKTINALDKAIAEENNVDDDDIKSLVDENERNILDDTPQPSWDEISSKSEEQISTSPGIDKKVKILFPSITNMLKAKEKVDENLQEDAVQVYDETSPLPLNEEHVSRDNNDNNQSFTNKEETKEISEESSEKIEKAEELPVSQESNQCIQEEKNENLRTEEAIDMLLTLVKSKVKDQEAKENYESILRNLQEVLCSNTVENQTLNDESEKPKNATLVIESNQTVTVNETPENEGNQMVTKENNTTLTIQKNQNETYESSETNKQKVMGNETVTIKQSDNLTFNMSGDKNLSKEVILGENRDTKNGRKVENRLQNFKKQLTDYKTKNFTVNKDSNRNPLKAFRPIGNVMIEQSKILPKAAASFIPKKNGSEIRRPMAQSTPESNPQVNRTQTIQFSPSGRPKPLSKVAPGAVASRQSLLTKRVLIPKLVKSERLANLRGPNKK